MYLERVLLANFKNYPQADLTFSEKINCFVGNNGAGKTNLLDAIHYLSFCKSFFNPSDLQNIRHDEPFFAINGTFVRNGSDREQVQVIQKRNQRKRVLLNKKEYDRLADHIGRYPVVMISPYDRDLINDGSEFRRRYIDSVIAQFDKLYLDDLIQYNRVLLQRNTLLRTFAETRAFNQESLEVWDQQLVRLGSALWQKRRQFLESFIPVFRKYFTMIAGGAEMVDIVYQSQLHETDFAVLLGNALPADRAAQYTTTGIHKDDLELLMGGMPVKRYGSQGQQKSFVVAIKLAQFEYTRDIKGFKPILLLDDIFDKLDDLRVTQLIRLVNEHNFGQVFVTDTSLERIRNVLGAIDSGYKVFQIPFREEQ